MVSVLLKYLLLGGLAAVALFGFTLRVLLAVESPPEGVVMNWALVAFAALILGIVILSRNCRD